MIVEYKNDLSNVIIIFHISWKVLSHFQIISQLFTSIDHKETNIANNIFGSVFEFIQLKKTWNSTLIYLYGLLF